MWAHTIEKKRRVACASDAKDLGCTILIPPLLPVANLNKVQAGEGGGARQY